MAERGQCVVVVESPAKAKTINKYLGKDFTVLASYGHVRDLPPKNGSVEPDRDFAMSWTVEGDSDKRLKAIAQAVKGAKALYLATDPDREGEAISWHIAEELKRRHAIDGLPVKRVTFNAITKSAVTEAFQNPRELDKDLIDAYLARRALDYLVGFTLSPVLWRKLPGSRSAGRVQSVALRLICQREAEIEIFRAEEYWTIDVSLRTPSGGSFQAHLSELKGKRLEKFDLPNEAAATAAADLLRNATRFDVALIEKKEVKRNPAPPFMTSSLQAEASRRLGFGASKTMKIAQKLYEGVELNGETVGLITYMRTDGVSLAGEALGQARRVIGEHFGDRYLPPAPRQYKTKAKNAQEAHEGIRPTDLGRRPEFIARHLEPDALKLYDLIWRRTLASQMASAELEQVGVDIGVDGNAAKLRATGQTVLFDGFLTLYQDQSTEAKDRDSDEESEDDRRLPKLERGDKLERQSVDPAQHFTQPPPRYSESGLIRKLEELGIGRPSTYTSILQVLQDRNYVKLDRRRFMPEDRGRIVTAFLENFFPRYVQYDFTADLEEQLDDISGGRKDYLTVLRDFWTAFKAAIDGTKELRISAVIDALDEALGPHFFPADSAQPGKDPRLCPSCGAGRLGLRLGKTGGFIGCSNYPDCRFTRTLALPGEGDADLAVGPRDLGEGPGGKKVTLRKGPFGFYVQLGEKDGDEKPKRASLPKGKNPSEITPAEALALLALPREVGRHPDGENIIAGIGRFGPYLKHGARYVNLKGDDDVLTIGLNRAVTVLAEAPAKKGKPQGKDLGAHPQSKQPIYLMAGRYGPYVKSGRTLVSLPKGTEAEGFSLEAAIALIDSKAKPGAKKKAAAKAPAEKPAAPKKSKTTKKPSAKAKKPAKKAG